MSDVSLGIVFCALCGKGVNLVRGDTPYKCSQCDKIVCDKCYSAEYLICIRCAAPLIRAAAEQERREQLQAQLQAEKRAKVQEAEQIRLQEMARAEGELRRQARFRQLDSWFADNRCLSCGEKNRPRWLYFRTCHEGHRVGSHPDERAWLQQNRGKVCQHCLCAIRWDNTVNSSGKCGVCRRIAKGEKFGFDQLRK